MNEVKVLLEKTLDDLMGREIALTTAKIGSMFILDFGELQTRKIHTKQGVKTLIAGQWSLWVKEADWKFERKGKTICNSTADVDEISFFLKSIVGAKLAVWEILSDLFDVRFDFEGGLSLVVTADNDDPDNEQWTLSTPDGGEFIAGPNATLVLQD